MAGQMIYLSLAAALGIIFFGSMVFLKKKKAGIMENDSLPAGLLKTKAPLSEKMARKIRSGGKSLVPQVMEIWDDLNPAVRDDLTKIWDELGLLEQYLDDLGSKLEEKSLPAAEFLIRIKDKKVMRELINAISVPGKMIPARVGEVLLSYGDAGLEALTEALPSFSIQGKCLALEILEETGDRRSSAAIMQELTHESPEVRGRAASALGEMAVAEAVDPLIGLLVDENWNVKSQAAKALGKIASPKAIPALKNALADEARWVRTNALSALRKMGVEEGYDG